MIRPAGIDAARAEILGALTAVERDGLALECAAVLSAECWTGRGAEFPVRADAIGATDDLLDAMCDPAVARLDHLTGIDLVEAVLWAHGVESPVLRVAVRVLWPRVPDGVAFDDPDFAPRGAVHCLADLTLEIPAPEVAS